MNSYADLLQPFLPYIPSGLISAECLRGILSATQGLPPLLGAGTCMFECSLDERPVADFSVAAMASRGDHFALGNLGSEQIRPTNFGNPAWMQILNFVGLWSDGTSSLNHRVDEVWLEFDVCLTEHASDNTPSVFFRLEFQSPPAGEPRRPACREFLASALEALEILRGRTTTSKILSSLATCMSKLPAGGRILFLGAMLSRVGEPIRVVVSGLELDGIVSYLHELGFSEPIGQVLQITELSRLTSRLWLAIDLDETGVTHRIGFDCYQDGSSRLDGGQSWADLLKFLVDNDICTDRKRKLLLNTAGLSYREFDGTVWPDRVRRTAQLLGPAGFDKMELAIHHIKVVSWPGRPLEAKAYLCGRYRESHPHFDGT